MRSLTPAGEGGKSTGVLERMFAPEFRNRLDATVNFNPLGAAEIGRVVDKHVDELRALVTDRNIKIELSADARQWLAEHGFDPQMGARPMARLLQEKVKRPLADELLFGKLAEGGRVTVDARDGELVVESRPEPEKLLPATVD